MSQVYKGWNISYWPKPIPTRAYDWEATHQDYDPPDDRHIARGSVREIKDDIDAWGEE